jgi:hypothetical protein
MSYLWSEQSEFMVIFVVCICGLVQVLFISLAVNVQFFNSNFLVTTIGLDLFSDTVLQNLQFLWCSVIEKS